MDDIEDFINKNRKEFDDQGPDKMKMWSNIEKELPSLQSTNVYILPKRYLKIAATLLVACLIASLLFLVPNSDQAKQSFAEKSELQDINSHYSRLIAAKLYQVQQSDKLSDADKKEFFDYFQELEDECASLEVDLEMNIDNEEVLTAIIENYRQRINLLEKLLTRINRSKNNNDEQGISI